MLSDCNLLKIIFQITRIKQINFILLILIHSQLILSTTANDIENILNDKIICKPRNYEIIKPFLNTQWAKARYELQVTDSSNRDILFSFNDRDYIVTSQKTKKQAFLER